MFAFMHETTVALAEKTVTFQRGLAGLVPAELFKGVRPACCLLHFSKRLGRPHACCTFPRGLVDLMLAALFKEAWSA